MTSCDYHAKIVDDENPHHEDLLQLYQRLIKMPFKKIKGVPVWVQYQSGEGATKSYSATTLLHIASGRGLTKLVELILNSQNNSKNTSIAVNSEWCEIPDNVGINTVDYNSYTPLLLAASKGYEDVVELLLQHSKIKVNAKSRWGQTALLCAPKGQEEGVVSLLL